MVIQANMTPKAIVNAWKVIDEVFKKYCISLSDQALETIGDAETLGMFLVELNETVGSSAITCIEGG